MMLINQVRPEVVASDALSLALSPRTQPAERGVDAPNADMFPRAFRACSGGFRFMVWLLVEESETCWPAAVILRSQLPPVGSQEAPVHKWSSSRLLGRPSTYEHVLAVGPPVWGPRTRGVRSRL
jgi:hypothetical protein